MIGDLFLRSGAPHQSQAPASEFRGGRSSDFKIRGAPSVPGSSLGVQGVIGVLILNQGRPISPRLQPRSSGVIGDLFLKSGAPHQSQAAASEFSGDRSSVFKIRGAPSVPGSSLGVQG